MNMKQLGAILEPFDLPHLLGLYAILTLFIFLWGIIAAISGGYASAKQFWKVHLIILGSIYLLSGIGFLLLNIDPLWLLVSLLALSFIAQGHFGTKDQPAPAEGADEAEDVEDEPLLELPVQQNEAEEEQEV